MNQTMIKMTDIHKSFGDHPVLAGVNLKVHKGESIAITAPAQVKALSCAVSTSWKALIKELLK